MAGEGVRHIKNKESRVIIASEFSVVTLEARRWNNGIKFSKRQLIPT